MSQVPAPVGGKSKWTDWDKILPSGFNPLNFYEYLKQSVRPWSVFFALSNFRPAPTIMRTQSRIVQNIAYFKANYIFVAVILGIYCIATSPVILMLLLGCGYGNYWVRRHNGPVRIMQHMLNVNQQVIGVNVLFSLLLFIFGAGSIFFWIIGASFCMNGLHAIFYNIDAVVGPAVQTSQTV